MNKLQHIKLFEAFESVKLSKTLGYIKDAKDRSTFLDRIKRLCNSIDFPYSKLSDEFFEYLPFKKALYKSDNITDDPCEATSKSEFPGYAVEGEKCTNGKIKRFWGSGTRNVVCPVCNGTGVKPKKGEIKLIKFWFTSDGRFVANTGVDGVIRQKGRRNYEDKLVANPYEWNVGLDWSWSGLHVYQHRDVESEIKDAHFAIILDFGKLRKSGFMTKSDIISQRTNIKSGSKLDPSQSDKEIKKRNIERYMSELAKRLDISSDITNCNKLISKTLGYKMALYTLAPTSIVSEYNNIIDYYLKIMSVSESNKSYYVERIQNKVEDLFTWAQKRNSTVASTLIDLKKRLIESDRESYAEFLDKLSELSAYIYKKISDYNIESIEDFEVVAQKMNSIKNILKSERYGLNKLCGYVLDYLNRNDGGERAFRYMIDGYYFNVEEASASLERISKIIEKI